MVLILFYFSDFVVHQPNSEYLQCYQAGMMVNSTKMFLLMHIIDMSVCIGDKILVYRCELVVCIHVRVNVYVCMCVYLLTAPLCSLSGFEVLI